MDRAQPVRTVPEKVKAKKKRKRPDDLSVEVNLCKQLLQREKSPQGNHSFKRSSTATKFKNFNLQLELDVCGPSDTTRPKIAEIVAAHRIICALDQSGVCTAFHRDSGRRLCFINDVKVEITKSIFYNKFNNCLIAVSINRDDCQGSLHCKSIPLQLIKQGKAHEGSTLFEEESIHWPGFVEFDDTNGKVLTYSAVNQTYKVWDLTNYDFLYAIPNPVNDIQEIKMSAGILLIIYNCVSDSIPLQTLSVNDGKVLRTFQHKLHVNKKVEFIEQFNEKLLIKQEAENLQILDVHNSSILDVKGTEALAPSGFIFMYENQLFFTVHEKSMCLWTFKGQLVATLEDNVLWNSSYNGNTIYITKKQDVIISYFKDPETEQGSINMSDILSGKHLASIKFDKEAVKPFTALQDVTTLYYNEDENEVYSGNERGYVHVWTN